MRESDLNRLRELAGLDKVAEAPTFNPNGTVAGAGQSARPGAMPPALNTAKPTIRRDPGDTGPSLLRQRLATTGDMNLQGPAGGDMNLQGPTTRNPNPDARDASTMAATQRSASQALDRSTAGTNTRIAPGTTAGGPSRLRQRLGQVNGPRPDSVNSGAPGFRPGQ